MLRVSENQRFLTGEDGRPFFWLGDTAWTMAQRLDRTGVDRYLEDRAAKGFTVVQVMGISEFDGLTAPNPDGEVPLVDGDPARPNDAYFRHIDSIVGRAAALGMLIALLPTWGDKVGPKLWGSGPEVFTPENAGGYGEYLGERYRGQAVVWVLGGDRTPTEERHRQTWRAMAAGLARGDGGRGLRTFHPQGGSSSADQFHADDWLDLNMVQSGHHARDTPNWMAIGRDYAREPTKPVLDGEPCYEDHPVNWKPEEGYFGAWDARKAAYWALFAGACGHTYGANGTFQSWDGAWEDEKFHARLPWWDALALPGAGQMRFARRLLESRPFFERVPDQGVIVSEVGSGALHVRATRAADGSYALVYLPSGGLVTVDLGRLSGREATASWYDPRTGASQEIGRFPTGRATRFASPSAGAGEDWVLVLDDVSREFALPGTAP